MKLFKFLFPIILAMVGTSLVVAGEVDDSPGLGGIGLIMNVVAVYISYKFFKNKV